MSDQRDFKLYLSSRQADGFPAGEARNDVLLFNLSEPIVARRSESIMAGVVQAVIPSTVFPVNATSNTLQYVINGGSIESFQLPVKLYTPASLATAIQTAFTTAGHAIGVTYDADLARLVIDPGAVLLTISLASPIGPVMGYSGPTVGAGEIDILAGSGANPAPYVIDLAGPRAYTVVCDELSLDSVDSTRTGTSEHVLCSVPVTAPFGGLNTYQSQTRELSHTSTRNIGRLTIRLLDEDMQPVDLQGSEWCIVIRAMVV
jgi:hypothetical protein